ncbi:MAG TPA: FHA domain-containing protein, partial [Solirubrobacterales bacterium]|nr:FHA domain-containing protein [Solirubrobacterales bacterium]
MDSGEQVSQRPVPASLLNGSERVPIASESLSIGRAEDNDLTIADEKASRRHAVVFARDGQWWVADLGSRHGTCVNGQPIGEEETILESGDSIEIGACELRFLGGEETRLGSEDSAPPTHIERVAFGRARVRIGRDPKNDVVLTDPNVSRFHAEVVPTGFGAEVQDLGSSNGTRVNGRLVKKSELVSGDSIGIGSYQLVFEGDSFSARDESGAIHLSADDVSVTVGDKTILQRVSVELKPGELVALIGESGAGKSTLMKAMAGVTRPSTGRVSINGESIYSRLTDVGYVPQDDIVHALLTVEEALDYAARLRLPADSTDEDRANAVGDAIAELSLETHAETMVGSLSGGQRKRTSVASEVLGRPGLLFLDEPTTGMDPGLETRMMELFRTLADRTRGVALVTHATKNLALCDRVVVMARGGRAVFDGPPAAALEFFGVEHYDDIYTALAKAPDGGWETAAPQRPAEPAAAETAEPAPAKRPAPQSFGRQLALLTSRSTKLLVRDRRNLGLLLIQAPVLALAGIALFEAGVFELGGNPGQAIQFLFLAVITVIWFGAIDAAR